MKSNFLYLQMLFSPANSQTYSLCCVLLVPSASIVEQILCLGSFTVRCYIQTLGVKLGSDMFSSLAKNWQHHQKSFHHFELKFYNSLWCVMNNRVLLEAWAVSDSAATWLMAIRRWHRT